ncbi:MAG: squalene--hopene cyclase [Pseudomonadales bacterium]|nr:squalene--hopene cyclase [Pseudomonadales bacterium]
MTSVNAVENKNELDPLIDAGLQWLDRSQHAEGFWVGMLESNCCMEAEWLLASHVLGIELPDSEALIRGILSKQRPDGAWETFFEAPSGDINTTVECYVALRAMGMEPTEAPMQAAREWILSHGGLSGIRVFTRYWLALLGEWPWDQTPNLPPEIIRLPTWVPFNIAHFSSWARATLVSLCVLSALHFTRPLPAARRPDELFPAGRDQFNHALPRRAGLFSWESLFSGVDRLLHFFQRKRLIPGRQAAIERCLEWAIRHQDADGAWCGIQPPWVYSLMALYAAGYALDHPVLARGLAALDAHWSYWRGDCKFIQASESPVWDTLLTLLAMQECGRQLDDCEPMQKALDWVLAHECRARGDWAVLTPQASPGGWTFQRANRNYPDIDDTAVAIMVFARLKNSRHSARVAEPLQRAIDWVLSMQSDNGGWGAFDRNNWTGIITKIPFCDFGEALDPPSADVTAHVVEALAAAGLPADHPAIRRAVAYLWNEQESAGCWFGRWGVNYIYGVAAVLPALAAVGEDMRQARVVKAVDWLLAHQNTDGGWGETCASYMDLSLAGQGVSTASQTAWAMLALVAAGHDHSREALVRAVDFLRRGQQQGSWEEPQYTGTGFPGYGFGARLEDPEGDLSARFMQGPELARAFMINYNLYRHYFPLMALGRARDWLGCGLHP